MTRPIISEIEKEVEKALLFSSNSMIGYKSEIELKKPVSPEIVLKVLSLYGFVLSRYSNNTINGYIKILHRKVDINIAIKGNRVKMWFS